MDLLRGVKRFSDMEMRLARVRRPTTAALGIPWIAGLSAVDHWWIVSGRVAFFGLQHHRADGRTHSDL